MAGVVAYDIQRVSVKPVHDMVSIIIRGNHKDYFGW